MKNNQPVTNNEVFFQEGQFIVSTTNLKGQITYVNRDFLEISGFTKDELIGKQHNIVRHPDMPSEAFADLWACLKNDKPWTGMVKNRCKNGDFYWVQANVTPMRDNDQVIGYLSVRTMPSRAQVSDAELLYHKINAGEASIHPGFFGRIKRRIQGISLRKHLWMSTLLSLGLMAGLALFARSGASTIALDIAFGLSALLIGAVSYLIARHVYGPVCQAVKALREIAMGDYFNWVETQRDDELGVMLQNLKSTQVRLGHAMNERMQTARINSRVKQALDCATTNVMIADPDNNIVYMNDAVTKMMKNAESELQKVLPDFDAGNLMGQSIDVFHKDPSHQRNLLANLQETYTADMKVGSLSLRIVATPVFSEKGKRLGTAVEWLDRTPEVAIEDEIETMVSNVLSGDFTKRIDTTNKNGFFKVLSGNINELMNVLENVVGDVGGSLEAMAHGDLTQYMEGQYQGQFKDLQDNVNATVAKLTDVVSEINSSAQQVLTGSLEISRGNTDLSQRTEQQAASLEQTASAMEQMTATVRQNADNAKQANTLAADARKQAESGGDVVRKAVGAMSAISESSKKINDIIGVIDEIAFQTNLLALNAAVEAARAGDQGRGFAVVASEVRNLAGRSATAAKEIKDLIGDSVVKVDEGYNLVDKSGKTLDEIMASVKKVSDIIADISAASQEQSEGIEEVNKAVGQMDETTQQNAALVEQAAAASEAMGDQAKNLSNQVGFFRTGNAVVSRAPAPAPAPAFVERRAKNRPWSDAPKATEVKASTMAVGSDVADDDDDWEEF